MEIYLVRHTTPDIEKGICYGQSDINLASSWQDEFKDITSKLPIHGKTHIISSPLKRCILLAKQLGETVTLDDRLKELNFGDWELQFWNTIPNNELNPWMENFVDTPATHGESYLDLANRVYQCLEEICKLKTHHPILIITHAGPIRAILAKLLHIPLESSFNIKVNYGDVFHISKENDNLYVKTEIVM